MARIGSFRHDRNSTVIPLPRCLYWSQVALILAVSLDGEKARAADPPSRFSQST